MIIHLYDFHFLVNVILIFHPKSKLLALLIGTYPKITFFETIRSVCENFSVKKPLNSDKGSATYNESANQENCLILVIGEDKQEMINNLKSNQSLSLDMCESLYRNARYIWYGFKRDCITFNEDAFLIKETDKESEYDVYFVKLILRQNDQRFRPKVSSVDRYAAFMQLAKTSKSIVMLGRFSYEAYIGKGFYK